jgi:Protein of unknown function (DUF1440)
MQRSGASNRKLLVNIAGGFAGGLAAAFAMEYFQRALGRLSPEVGGVPGAGGQQYRQPQSEPPTYQAAEMIAPSAPKREAAAAIHYAFGGALGAIYGAVAARNPDITTGAGLPFGASVWLIADELGMPVVGLAKSPAEYPLEDHLTTFASHLLFGATAEAVRRCVVTSLR